MRAARFHRTGGPDRIRVETVDRPSPRPDEVLVDVRAIGINPTEVYSREGDRPHELPRIPGADFAGVVEAVGETVDGVREGTRVFGTGLQNDRQGSYAEYTVARADRFATLPDEVSFEQGAAAGVVGATAWLSFVEHARLTPTSTCLVHGGSGGVGHVAVQLAKLCGATVVTTSGSDASREFAAECGADVTLDYGQPDLLSKIEGAVDGGIDVVLEHRAGSHLQLDLEVLGEDGTVVVIGGPQDECRITDLWPALRTDANVQVFAMSNEPDLGAVLAEVGQLMADDRLEIHIARRYDLEEAAAAQRAVIEDSFQGKLIIVP
jgi:NADPH2:quinone reductase